MPSAKLEDHCVGKNCLGYVCFLENNRRELKSAQRSIGALKLVCVSAMNRRYHGKATSIIML